MSPPKKMGYRFPFEPKFEGTSIFTDDVKWRQKAPQTVGILSGKDLGHYLVDNANGSFNGVKANGAEWEWGKIYGDISGALSIDGFFSEAKVA